jgi:uncharacterized protein YukE
MDLLKLIKESRVDDFIDKYRQKFSPEMISKITSEITPKFFQWAGKVMDGVNFDDNFIKLNEALKRFEKISTNLPKTDINQYQTLEELITAITNYEGKSRRNIKKVQGGNVVYDDGKYFVVNPLNHEASCYYGKGTKWCTAAETDTHFKKYNEDGKLFYIIDKTKPTNDPYYKVALLRKFDGDKIYYDSKDETIKNGWILGTETLDKILNNITGYLQQEFAEQVKIFSDRESARKEKQRLERIREQQRVQLLRNDAQERRTENEWALDGNTPEEGLKAYALLEYLVDNEGVSVLNNDDRADIQRIKDEIERLNGEYDADEDPNVGILNQIESLEDELDAYSEYIDVYYIIPTGNFYDTTEFEVIDSSVSGNRYAVGDDGEMRSSCYEYVEQLIDDIGYEGFNKGFASQYLDTDAIVSYAEDVWEDLVRDSPSSYFEDSERMLSNEQEEKIEILKKRIENIERTIEHLEEQWDGENDDMIQEKIDELNEVLEEYSTEIEEIEEDPEGDFPEDLIEDKVDELVSNAKRDPEGFMEEFGLSWSDYVDKDEFIEGVIDADGYGATLNSYDGNADEIYVGDKLFYVMRID